ncbi:Fanconi anemia group J protein homolog isoform X2 [Ptychodera flava]|uniref:Fanconi anemia group J protein homolog isoform X2 n=1 Tax=Ptychodera flava TaxID=63121 RepID=UPI003969C8F2
MASPGIERSIGGVKVQFPCKPYPSQFSMMNKIIQGLQRQQNCLLESPTGSGKSLALLCSCLAWQKAELERQLLLQQKEENCCNTEIVIDNPNCQCHCHRPPGTAINNGIPQPMQATQQMQSIVKQMQADSAVDIQEQTNNNNNNNETNTSASVVKQESQEDDFKPAQKKFRTPAQRAGKKKSQKGVVYEDDPEDLESCTSTPPQWQMQLKNPSGFGLDLVSQGVTNAEVCSPCTCNCGQTLSGSPQMENKPKKIKVPRIFFGTRTHKQIAQIVRELRRTAYRDVRMVILASRAHYCVHPHVSKSSNKNEGCKQLLEQKNGDNCSYFHHVHKIKTQTHLRLREGFDTAWDVEDLVTLGKRIRACPYFAVRSLMEEADIIFCPYNYLIDPKIRSAMEIVLKDQVVVLDEAHNIEDSSRDAASFRVTQEELEDAMDELDKLIAMKVKAEDMLAMREMCVGFVRWIHSMSGTLRHTEFEKSQRVWSGVDFIAVLDSMAITPLTIPMLRHSFGNIMADNFDPSKPDQPSLSSHTASLLEGLFIILDYLFRENLKFMHDYRIALEKTKSIHSYTSNHGGWLTTRRGDKPWTYTVHFWCMNPAVAFNDVSSCSRSIVLTSGTLSPMASFSSELGVLFPIQLESNHVIHNSQVWVGTVATGPSGGILNATYKYAETYSFQDEIGALILKVCHSIPHGVLCFFPSYSMMEKLAKRWRATRLWDQLERRKFVICEPRGGDKADFDDLLRQFYDAILESEDSDADSNGVNGSLFLAVCRGKVSEGLDFADNNARAVITVGIPFPNFKDSVVELKKKYNNEHMAARGLLSGSDWYEIQAYRALNQALGRCIRHRQDWGALILVDERFGKNPGRYIKGLSKWVRQQVKHYYRFSDANASLDLFAKARLCDPCPEISLNNSLGVPCSQVNLDDSLLPSQDTKTMVIKPRQKELTNSTTVIDLAADYPGNRNCDFLVSPMVNKTAKSKTSQFKAKSKDEQALPKKGFIYQPTIGNFLHNSRQGLVSASNSISTVTPDRDGGSSHVAADSQRVSPFFSPAVCSASKVESSQQLPTPKGKLCFDGVEDAGSAVHLEVSKSSESGAAATKGRLALKQFAYRSQHGTEVEPNKVLHATQGVEAKSEPDGTGEDNAFSECREGNNVSSNPKENSATPKSVNTQQKPNSTQLYKFLKISKNETSITCEDSSIANDPCLNLDDDLDCTPPLFDESELAKEGEHTTEAAQNESSNMTSSDGPTNRRRLFRLPCTKKEQAVETTDGGSDGEVSAPVRKTPRGRKRKGASGGKHQGKPCKTAKGNADILDELDHVEPDATLQGDDCVETGQRRPCVSCVRCEARIVHQLVFEFNCRWSEEDESCYQPMVCSACSTGGKRLAKPAVVGLKVVSLKEQPSNENSDDEGHRTQVWFLPQAVCVCAKPPTKTGT